MDREVVSHLIFSTLYHWLFHGLPKRHFLGPLWRETAGKAAGIVLEVGEGLGLTFPYYDPSRVERVEATKPDTAMLHYART